MKLSTTALLAYIWMVMIGPAALADERANAPQMSPSQHQLQQRVSSALRSDPYLSSRHIEVTIKDGNVVLTGFVQSDWELDKALRDANEAAKPNKVIDALKIEEGGRR